MRMFGFDFAARPTPPASQELALAWEPYFLECIEAFGPERCMFESSFPVDEGTCSYAVLWHAFKRIAGAFGEAENTAPFGGTAARVYRIAPPAGQGVAAAATPPG